MCISLLFTPFFLLRLYSSTEDIDKAIQASADKFTFGVNNTSKPDKNMSGGADEEKEDTDNDTDDDGLTDGYEVNACKGQCRTTIVTNYLNVQYGIFVASEEEFNTTSLRTLSSSK